MRRRILKENMENTSTNKFKKFIEIVKEKGLFQGAQWGLTTKNSTQYYNIEDFEKKFEKQIEDAELKGSPITNYWIWGIGSPWTKKIDKDGNETRLSPEIDKAMDGGLAGILTLGVNNKKFDNVNGKITDFGRIETSFTSKDQEEFGKFMSSGDGGSLDENLEINENELASLGGELADLIKIEVGDEAEIKEIIDPVTILSTVLASTTLINIISKYVGKIFKKYNFEKGEKGAKMIYDFTHKLENDFKKPIQRVVGLFTKDEKVKSKVTDGLYALMILSLGLHAGGGAIQSLDKGNIASGSISSLKAALKGKDLATLLKSIVSNV